MPTQQDKTNDKIDKRLKIGGRVSLIVGVLGAVFSFTAFFGKIPEMAALAGNPVVITFAAIFLLAAVVGVAFTIYYTAGPDKEVGGIQDVKKVNSKSLDSSVTAQLEALGLNSSEGHALTPLPPPPPPPPPPSAKDS